MVRDERRTFSALVFLVECPLDLRYRPEVYVGDSSTFAWGVVTTAASDPEQREARRYRERWRFRHNGIFRTLSPRPTLYVLEIWPHRLWVAPRPLYCATRVCSPTRSFTGCRPAVGLGEVSGCQSVDARGSHAVLISLKSLGGSFISRMAFRLSPTSSSIRRGTRPCSSRVGCTRSISICWRLRWPCRPFAVLRGTHASSAAGCSWSPIEMGIA